LSYDGVHCHRPFSLSVFAIGDVKIHPIAQTIATSAGVQSRYHLTMVSEETNSSVVELISRLYPGASDEELRETQQSLIEYVAAVLRIFDRIDSEHAGDSRDDADRSRIRVAKSNDV
jgi:hypothetical protein